MAKYTVKHTSILHNKKVYAEGSIVELTDNQAKRLEDFVELVPEVSIPKPPSQNTKTTKSKTNKTKTESKTETVKKDFADSDGGSNNDV